LGTVARHIGDERRDHRYELLPETADIADRARRQLLHGKCPVRDAGGHATGAQPRRRATDPVTVGLAAPEGASAREQGERNQARR
jgi:hypothetical protein